MSRGMPQSQITANQRSHTEEQQTQKTKLNEKSREYPDRKLQPTHDTKRKRKTNKTQIYAYMINKRMHEKHVDQIFLPQARWS